MQVDGTRMYRVKAVAEMLDVSVATIYRAIESGALRALKIGTGKGALRVEADAITEYKKSCQQAALASTTALPEVA
ncbi:helix-turn-helix transcriptional regulator [Saccharothrix deserti]|uniref:helix-turn-helix transcriptional regulator n=1 Tax=Saccharothrix deserti TaxID=2593674 RepID=UPI001EE4559C|nr:helix-turn-helix domain-containing protein [Saccharothrix deserti]